jgi:hypothetical protein
MKNPGSRTDPASWRKALLAYLAAVALAFGVLVPHDPISEHSGAPAGVEIDKGAIHPNAPAHLEEGSRAEFHPPCVGCLLQLQTASTPIRLAAALAAPDHGGTVVAPPERLSSVAVPHLGPARAPPASPAFA